MEIKNNIDLSQYSTFKIGGKAKKFVQISSLADFKSSVKLCVEKKWPIFILGGGSNILFSDEGFDGLVLKLWSDKIFLKEASKGVEGKKEKVLVVAEAGVNLMSFVNFCCQNSLSGMEWASGIPGTIGGAVRGNAGAFGGEMKDAVVEVEFFDLKEFRDGGELKLKKISAENCNFEYRSSLFKKEEQKVVWRVTFELELGDQVKIKDQMKEIILLRTSKQPMLVKFPSAGSFFKNPVAPVEVQKMFEEEKGVECRGGKVPAGWIIEKAGLKGKKIGGAMISDLQANFIVNFDQASARDVASLAELVQEEVLSKFGVELESEVQLVF